MCLSLPPTPNRTTPWHVNTHTHTHTHTHTQANTHLQGQGSKVTRKGLGWKTAFFHMSLLSHLDHGRLVLACRPGVCVCVCVCAHAGKTIERETKGSLTTQWVSCGLIEKLGQTSAALFHFNAKRCIQSWSHPGWI